MVNWRTAAVGLMLCVAAWLIGCEGEQGQESRNSQEQDSLVLIARMKAEVDAERADARKAATQPASPTATLPRPTPSPLPAYRPEPGTAPAPAVTPQPEPEPAPTVTDTPEPTETPVEPSGGG